MTIRKFASVYAQVAAASGRDQTDRRAYESPCKRLLPRLLPESRQINAIAFGGVAALTPLYQAPLAPYISNHVKLRQSHSMHFNILPSSMSQI
ncbi:hypothetical protein NXS19_010271 [Fusarium pseudograminearum]|nr:hypothetical protein NXS19_010271 [Fusarium pseudograminearum]